MITAHRLNDAGLIFETLAAFFSFSLLASGIYILNDLMDLKSDRQHRTKKFRPIAAGNISIPSAMSLMFILVLTSFAIALQLPIVFSYVLIMYLVLTTSYSFFLKQVAILDVVLLACLYTTRIFAGVVTSSDWSA